MFIVRGEKAIDLTRNLGLGRDIDNFQVLAARNSNFDSESKALPELTLEASARSVIRSAKPRTGMPARKPFIPRVDNRSILVLV